MTPSPDPKQALLPCPFCGGSAALARPNEKASFTLMRDEMLYLIRRLTAVAPAGMEGWIPVSERLPEPGVRVLTWHDCGGEVMNPAHHAYGQRGWIEVQMVLHGGSFVTDLTNTGSVTHWALPTPPATAGEEGAK